MDSLLWFSAPQSVEKLIKHMNSKAVSKSALHKLAKLAVKHWQNNPPSTEEWDAVVNESHTSRAILSEVYAGLLSTVLAVFRLPEHKFIPSKLEAELTNLGLPVTVIQLLVSSRHVAQEIGLQFPHLVSTKWRVDIVISSSFVGRVLEPSILLELEMDSGSVKQIQLTLQQFHNLRCKVASALHDMHQIM